MYKVVVFYTVLYNSRAIRYLFCSPVRFLLVRVFTSLRFTFRFRVCHHPSDYMAQNKPLSRARGTEWRPACLTSSVWRAIRNSVPTPPTLLLYTAGRGRSKFPDTHEHPLFPPATNATVLTVKCNKNNRQSVIAQFYSDIEFHILAKSKHSFPYSHSTTNKIHLLSQIIYSCKTLYMFRTVFPSIIRSSKLRIQQRYMSNSCCYLLLSEMRCNSVEHFTRINNLR